MNQKFAADVTGNAAVSSQDAAKIAQFVAGLPTAPPNNTGIWRFFTANFPQPPASPIPTPPYNETRTYGSVSGNLANEDYIALLIGEASGNYNPALHARSDVGPERITSVTLPSLVTSDEIIVIPVSVSGAVGKDIIAYEFDLKYDPTVVQPLLDAVDLANTASRALSVVVNPNQPGILRVVMYGAYPIDRDGVLLNLRFTAVGTPRSVSPLSIERMMFNEGDPAVVVGAGLIEIN
jgi:hypothetical protein